MLKKPDGDHRHGAKLDRRVAVPADRHRAAGQPLKELHAAARGGDAWEVRRVVETARRWYGLAVDLEDQAPDGLTPLHAAAAGGHLQALRVLVELGAHVEGGAVCGRHVAAMLGRSKAAQVLVLVLVLVKELGSTRTAGAAVLASAQPQREAEKTSSRGDHLSRLFDAIQRDDAKAVRRLVKETGVSVEQAGAGNMKPLHTAARLGHVKTMRVLVRLGADVEGRDGNGQYGAGGEAVGAGVGRHGGR